MINPDANARKELDRLKKENPLGYFLKQFDEAIHCMGMKLQVAISTCTLSDGSCNGKEEVIREICAAAKAIHDLYAKLEKENLKWPSE